MLLAVTQHYLKGGRRRLLRHCKPKRHASCIQDQCDWYECFMSLVQHTHDVSLIHKLPGELLILGGIAAIRFGLS